MFVFRSAILRRRVELDRLTEQNTLEFDLFRIFIRMHGYAYTV